MSLNAFDLFYTSGRTTIIDEPGLYFEIDNRWRTRSFRVKFVDRIVSANLNPEPCTLNPEPWNLSSARSELKEVFPKVQYPLIFVRQIP